MFIKIPATIMTAAALLAGATVHISCGSNGEIAKRSNVPRSASIDSLLLPPEPPPPGAAEEFGTDFNRHTAAYDEIMSGGPSKDGIPAVDHPRFVSVAEADGRLKPNEPVILLRVGDRARAYPLQIVTWHEIVNDSLAGTPVVVTFCPLCNTAVAFDRRLDGVVLDFGTTGRLRYSNLIMYDRQSESWWQQATGEAIAGAFAGRTLDILPVSVISWNDFKESYPDDSVLSQETGFRRRYGNNPYAGYDDIGASPFLYRGPAISGALPPMARVLALELDGESVAYPYDLLERLRVVEDSVAGRAVVVFWGAGTSSALDNEEIAMGRDVGAATLFEPVVEGRRLHFRIEGESIVDTETGSVWNLTGRAVQGTLAGKRLTALPGVNHFWFSWSVFRPATRVYGIGASQNSR